MEGPSTSSRPDLSAQAFNRRGAGHLPGLVGLEIISVTSEAIESRGYGCVVNLPQGAHGLTPIELKTDFLGAAPRRQRQGHRPVPLHPDGAVADGRRKSCQRTPRVIQSRLRSTR